MNNKPLSDRKFVDSVLYLGEVCGMTYDVDFIRVSDIVKRYNINRSSIHRAIRSNKIDGFMITNGAVTPIRYYVFINDKYNNWISSELEKLKAD